MDTGKYTKSFSAEDIGEVPATCSGNVQDESTGTTLDIWIVDLQEQTRTIKIQKEQVFPISLKFSPTDFPHEDICYIAAYWGMAMPGMPVPASNLFLDPECTTAITGDSTYSGEKSWKIGTSIPETIYYKRPANATSNHNIKITLRAKTTNYSADIVTRTLTFANAGTLYPNQMYTLNKTLREATNNSIIGFA